MHCAAVLCFCALLACVRAQAEEGFYDSRYDYLDIDTILDNKRLVRNYVDCLLNEKPCTAEGKQLRRILPEGLRTKCARCTPRQKHNALTILRRLRAEHPKDWQRLASRWDPSGDITRRFEDFLEKDDNNRIDEKPFQTQPSQRPIQTPRPTTRPTTAPPPPPPPALAPSFSNRFDLGEQDEQPSSTNLKPTIRSVSTTLRTMTTASPSTFDLDRISTQQPPVISTTQQRKEETTPRPTARPKTKPPNTRKPIEHIPQPSPVNLDLTPIYAGTMGLIDHFGNKIIRTTEFVTDILRNTVRVVVGPHANRN